MRPLEQTLAAIEASRLEAQRAERKAFADRLPILLEPTPAQLAAGRRTLIIERSTFKSANTLLVIARTAHWDAWITRSRYLSEIKISGKFKGEREERERHVVRLAKRVGGVELSGYACWDVRVADKVGGFVEAKLTTVTRTADDGRMIALPRTLSWDEIQRVVRETVS